VCIGHHTHPYPHPYPQFDGVIYVRADVLLLNPVPFFLLKRPQTLFLPDFHRSCKVFIVLNPVLFI
jgi:hypothetical protein